MLKLDPDPMQNCLDPPQHCSVLYPGLRAHILAQKAAKAAEGTGKDDLKGTGKDDNKDDLKEQPKKPSIKERRQNIAVTEIMLWANSRAKKVNGLCKGRGTGQAKNLTVCLLPDGGGGRLG